MRIVAAASAFPRHHYTQKALGKALLAHWADRLPDPRKLELLHSNVGVEGRFLALPIEAYPELTWGEANNAWIKHAEELGMTAICRALAHAGLANSELGAFYFVSVTGISSPSIDARLINRMKLSPNIRRVPIFGLGCVAGAAGIARAADYVRAWPDQFAVLLSVELCSLTLQRDDFSVANLISTRIVRRRGGGGYCGRRRMRASGAGDRGHTIGVLSGYAGCDGLGHFRKGVQGCLVARSAGRDCTQRGARRRYIACAARVDAGRHWLLDSAHGRTENIARHAAGFGDR